MNDQRGDEDLRALFEAQRDDDAQSAPAFAEMRARAHAGVLRADDVAHTERTQGTRRLRHRLEWLGGLAAAAAITALILVPRLGDGADEFEDAVRAFQTDPALGAWQSPTDGLLQLPGDGLLTTIPTIGTAQ